MKEQNPHLTLTLSPPIRMGAEREQQAGATSDLEDWQLTSGSWSQCMRKSERQAGKPEIFQAGTTTQRGCADP